MWAKRGMARQSLARKARGCGAGMCSRPSASIVAPQDAGMTLQAARDGAPRVARRIAQQALRRSDGPTLSVARATFHADRRTPVRRSVAAGSSDGPTDIRAESTDCTRDAAIVPLRGPTRAGCGAD